MYTCRHEKQEMDGRLHEAALTGDVSALQELLANDAHVLERVVVVDAPRENPLHIAARFGHSDFALEIINRKRELVCQLNSRGQSPLHAASNREMAKTLLEVNTDVCFVRDKDGRTPLHIAAMKGRLDVLEELIDAKSKAAWVLTDAGEPLLHLCANYNQFEALKLLVNKMEDKEFYKLRDTDNTTILHLLTAKGHYKDIKNVLEKIKQKSDILDAADSSNGTAADAAGSIKGGRNRQRIRKAINSNRAGRAKRANGLSNRCRDSLGGNNHEALMVVAILITTITYTAAMNPPGGVWQDVGGGQMNSNSTDPSISWEPYHLPGMAVLPSVSPYVYRAFTVFNTIGFLSSITMILVLVSRSMFQRKVLVLTMKVTIVTALLSLVITYGLLSSIIVRSVPLLVPLGISAIGAGGLAIMMIIYSVLIGRLIVWLLCKLLFAISWLVSRSKVKLLSLLQRCSPILQAIRSRSNVEHIV